MAQTNPIKLMIVDDHTMFREGLRAVLERQPDFVLVGEAGSAAAAVRMADELRPDVILMDLHLGQDNGVAATEAILARHPQIRVIALTIHHDDELIRSMFTAGAQGYILKDARTAELVQAVRTVAAGGAAINPQVAARLLESYRQNSTQPPRVVLTSSRMEWKARDLELLRQLQQGKSNQEIAGALGLSQQTIKNLLTGLYQKLDVGSRGEAVATAAGRGLLVPLSP